MNPSELLRRQQIAANQYKSYWQPRDASEVTSRNAAIANNIQNQNSNYYPPPPLAGSTQIQGASNLPYRVVCDRPQAPGNGFDPSYDFTTILNRKEGNTVCGDMNWGGAGGVTLQSCSTIPTILNPISPCNATIYPPNPVAGLRWISGSNGVLFTQLVSDCPPNNSAQTPHFASNPRCLPYYNPLDNASTIVVPLTTYGAYTPKNRQLA